MPRSTTAATGSSNRSNSGLPDAETTNEATTPVHAIRPTGPKVVEVFSQRDQCGTEGPRTVGTSTNVPASQTAARGVSSRAGS